MYSSRRNSPCPICSRTKDTDCRWNDDVILCHQGTTHGPPTHLKPGNTLDLDGQKWALVSMTGGFDGAAHVFRPHQERRNRAPTFARQGNKQELFDLSVKSACARSDADDFLVIAQDALDVLDFESAPPDELKESFALIYKAERQGLAVHEELQSLLRDDKELRPVFELVNSTLKDLLYQRKDADSFRKHMLGEILL